MKMTINNAISFLKDIDDPLYFSQEICNATKVAMDSMHKYQKIEEIVSEWNNHCISTQVAISEIANEVIEDGKIY